MNILKYATKTIILAGIITVLAAGPSFAVIKECIGENSSHPSLSTEGGPDTKYPVRCQQVKDSETDKYVTVYGKTAADCAEAGEIAAEPEEYCAITRSEPIDDETGEATMNEEDPDDDGTDAPEDEDDEDDVDNPQEETAADTAGPSEDTGKKNEGLPMVAIIGIIVGVVVVIAAIVVAIIMSKKKGGKNTPQAPDAGQTPQTDPNATPDAPTADQTPQANPFTTPNTPETPVEQNSQDNPFATPETPEQNS